MAIALLNPIFTALNGRIGNLVFYTCDNKTCIRAYVKPRNPDTPAQRANRGLFSGAMKAWRGLSSYDKASYARRAGRLGMTGHNLFISRYMTSHRENTGGEALKDKDMQDRQAVRRVFSPLYSISRSVSGSMMRQVTPDTGPAGILHPDGS